MTCKVVCISHATGSGGEEVGRLVAERLGFLFVDEEIIARAAARAGIDPDDVADEERRKSFAARVLEAVAHGGQAWSLTGSVPLRVGDEPSSEDVRALIRETIEQTAEQGNAVIVAHAASHAVVAGPEALRVLITSSPGTRAKRVGRVEGLDQAQAAKAVTDSDAGRRDYLKRFYDVDEEVATYYDLVVNTDVLTVEQAADLVSQAASSESSSATGASHR